MAIVCPDLDRNVVRCALEVIGYSPREGLSCQCPTRPGELGSQGEGQILLTVLWLGSSLLVWIDIDLDLLTLGAALGQQHLLFSSMCHVDTTVYGIYIGVLYRHPTSPTTEQR